jgi:hypothetical protein
MPSVIYHFAVSPCKVRHITVAYILTVVIILLIAPHPSIIIILVNHHIRTLHEPLVACIHGLVIYFLAFLTFSSLLVCVVRDPGSVSDRHMAGNVAAEQGDNTANEDELSRLVADDDGLDSEDEVEMMDFNEALAVGVDTSTQKWCKKCMVRSPHPSASLFDNLHSTGPKTRTDPPLLKLWQVHPENG